MSEQPRADHAWRERVTEMLGTSLDEFNVLDEDEVRSWSTRRDELFRRGQKHGLKRHDGYCTNLYTRELSPGCQRCAEGTWSCLYINNRCNCRCFYCPQDLQGSPQRPTLEGAYMTPFQRPEDYVVFLRNLKYRGMSISGGEPFLTFDKTLDYIRHTRENFGREMYIWAYTNGALYTTERGEALVEAGLDELRFDISAREYDLDAVTSAVKTIPAVAVEIPAIPEDQDTVLGLLPRLEALGVRFLNLHQLYTTRNNGGAMGDRHYTLIRGEGRNPAILESEICALEIMCHALEEKIHVPINYCSHAYKVRFQSQGHRQRLVDMVTRTGTTPEMGEPTATAMFRQLAICGEVADNRILADRLRHTGVDASLFALAADSSALFLHPDVLDHELIGPRRVVVAYFRYEVAKAPTAVRHDGKPIGREPAPRPGLRRVGPVGHVALHNEVARLGFRKLFVEGWPMAKTQRHLATRVRADAAERERIASCLQQLEDFGKRGFERLDSEFAAYA